MTTLKSDTKRDAALAKIAEAVGKSEAQVCVRWLLQKGFTTIPKSTRERHIRDNAAVFDFSLSDAQMAEIDTLDQTFFASNAVRAMWTPWDEVK